MLKVFLFGVFALFFIFPPSTAHGVPVHGVSMHGDLKYPDPQSFRHFLFYNPDAPKGGTIRLPLVGRVFDTLNPFVFQGTPAMGLGMYHYLPFDQLMSRAPDEPFSLYGRLAEKVELAKDRSWIIFHLNPKAFFNDGAKTPVQATDVVFTFHALHKYGSPARRLMGDKVASVDVLSPLVVKFTFKKVSDRYDRELPLVIALMPVLSEKSLKDVAFDKTGQTPLVGSGPYRVSFVDPGRTITYERVPEYWGRDLPVNRGLYNFDRIVYEYFGTEIAAFEAFKKGMVDYWRETAVSRWVSGYDFSAVKDGRILRFELPKPRPMCILGFVFNTRRTFFADVRVRKALGYLFDFNWLNKHLFHGAYVRTTSFFQGTELEAKGLPTAGEEKILSLLPGLGPEVMGDLPVVSSTDGSGVLRQEIRKAHALLKEAGWVFQDNQWVHPQTKSLLSFEILITEPKRQRIAEAYARALEKAGIKVAVRMVDGAEYQNRLRKNNFDMIVHPYGHSLSPGCEQKLYWLSNFAFVPSRNYAGVCSQAIDAAMEHIVQASTRDTLVTAVRVLDRLLRHGHYLVPLFHRAHDYLAYWKHLDHPPFVKEESCHIYSWWSSQKP